MQFRDVIGQEAIKRQLIRAVNENRVSHALLLAGAPGTGNFPLALAFAQYLQCSNRGEVDSCGVCPSCNQAAKLIHPDIHFAFPVAKTAKIKELVKGVDEVHSDPFLPLWREYLLANPYPTAASWGDEMGVENQQPGIFVKEAREILRKLSFKSFESDHKVLLLWMPEKMNVQTANKLLKIIEEPPVMTVFLLITAQPEELLPTILSRTQLIKVQPLEDEPVRLRLISEYPDNPVQVEDAMRLAQGDYLKAVERIRLSEQISFFRELFIRWTRLSFGMKYLELQGVINEMAQMGREKQKAFFEYSLGLLRQNFMLQIGMAHLSVTDHEEAAFSERFNRFVHRRNIHLLMHELQQAAFQIGMNANPKILFTDLSFKMCDLLRLTP